MRQHVVKYAVGRCSKKHTFFFSATACGHGEQDRAFKVKEESGEAASFNFFAVIVGRFDQPSARRPAGGWSPAK